MTGLLKSKLLWAVAIGVALVVLYAVLGFKIAPGIARDQARAFVREHYQRELAIGEISIHPFRLQAEVRDLALPDTDGRTMLGFERLFVDFEIASLWAGAYTFKEVVLEAPLLRTVVRPDGSLNLADLALPEEPPAQPIPSVWIRELDVERGMVEFVDEARARPFARSFRVVGFELDDFRTTPEGGSIIGRVTKELKRAKEIALAHEFQSKAFRCGSYDELLQLTMEYVEVEQWTSTNWSSAALASTWTRSKPPLPRSRMTR